MITKRIRNVSIDKKIDKQLDKIASKQRRSVSYLIEEAIKQVYKLK